MPTLWFNIHEFKYTLCFFIFLRFLVMYVCCCWHSSVFFTVYGSLQVLISKLGKNSCPLRHWCIAVPHPIHLPLAKRGVHSGKVVWTSFPSLVPSIHGGKSISHPYCYYYITEWNWMCINVSTMCHYSTKRRLILIFWVVTLVNIRIRGHKGARYNYFFLIFG